MTCRPLVARRLLSTLWCQLSDLIWVNTPRHISAEYQLHFSAYFLKPSAGRRRTFQCETPSCQRVLINGNVSWVARDCRNYKDHPVRISISLLRLGRHCCCCCYLIWSRAWNPICLRLAAVISSETTMWRAFATAIMFGDGGAYESRVGAMT